MDLIAKAIQAIREDPSFAEAELISKAIQAMQEDLKSYEPLHQRIQQQMKAIQDAVGGTELWRAMNAIKQLDTENWHSKSLLSFPQPAPRKWSVDSDPNVPAEFKRKWRNVLQAEPRQKQKVLAVWSLIAAKNPETLIKPLQAANSPKPTLYSIEANAICQYLKLGEEHYRLGKGPVTKGELWDRVCALHIAYFKSSRPTHRSLILKKIGLASLPKRPAGRPSRK
jgi:hypothetical protein